ncbi:hypothetical protein IW140_001909 [Coemansia sp. RSA 1813]|nr:hypothetical protein EV178_005076 [Coemansia sp. RSA 1646]KAJ1769908.1 hypothetical protein LPJ74_003629 [Coemansia sp. RSA 1843]KAJ2087246.1 hypothetical protein IW138_005092 [Coemansia sp. RSA 986]KAJ2212092.1 hypothetical protein EV179_004954 [Coemansia sp. RSA 487]KAJ2570955.1 hypothetical protein IW140_001909 [Coemansia sp. RSA 1813]
MTQTVAIIGATGLQGGSVLRSLHATGKYKLVAMTRNISSAQANEIKNKYPDVELAAADVEDIDSLKKAFEGADFVFGMTQFFQPAIMDKIETGDFDAEYKQGKNIVDAAVAANVKNIIFSSLPSMKEISGGKYPNVHHFEGKNRAEAYLKSNADKIRGVAVHVGSYMENFVNYARVSPEDNETIEFPFPYSPEALLPLVDVANDTGAVVSYIISHFDDYVGRAIGVSGGYYSLQDMVGAFTEATGKPARYVQIPHAYFKSEDLEQMFKGIEEFGLFNGSTEFLEFNKKLEHKLTTPIEYWKTRGWTGPSK